MFANKSWCIAECTRKRQNLHSDSDGVLSCGQPTIEQACAGENTPGKISRSRPERIGASRRWQNGMRTFCNSTTGTTLQHKHSVRADSAYTYGHGRHGDQMTHLLALWFSVVVRLVHWFKVRERKVVVAIIVVRLADLGQADNVQFGDHIAIFVLLQNARARAHTHTHSRRCYTCAARRCRCKTTPTHFVQNKNTLPHTTCTRALVAFIARTKRHC